MAEVKDKDVLAPFYGKTVRVPFDALVEELGLKKAVQFISRIKENYGDSVLELREKTKDLSMDEVEKRLRK